MTNRNCSVTQQRVTTDRLETSAILPKIFLNYLEKSYNKSDFIYKTHLSDITYHKTLIESTADFYKRPQYNEYE